MLFGPNIHTYISNLGSFCDPPRPQTLDIYRQKTENHQKTSKTNCYTEMYFGCLGTFPRYLSSEKGQTYIQTFRRNNFLTPKISLYVSETSINIEQIRFYIHRKPCVFENHGKYRAFSNTMVNIMQIRSYIQSNSRRKASTSSN